MTPETVLETERLILTNWLPEHAGDLMALYSDAEVTRYLWSDGQPATRKKVDELLAVWADNFRTHRMGKLRAIRKADGVLVGRAGFGLYGPTGEPEIGYAMFRAHWGHGYASEAAAGLRDWIFTETDWDHFIGFADVRNAASLKVLRGIGMRETHRDVEPNGLSCQFHIYEKADWHG